MRPGPWPYLARYLAGEHEKVWEELVALGPAVREEPVLSDAAAVARETMRRVRHNIETVHRRLVGLGFPFADGDRAFIPAAPDALQRIEAAERELGPFPLSLKAFYCEVERVNFRQERREPPDPLFGGLGYLSALVVLGWQEGLEAGRTRFAGTDGAVVVIRERPSGRSGTFLIPTPEADAEVGCFRSRFYSRDFSFLDVLRGKLRWSGFPTAPHLGEPEAGLADIPSPSPEVLPLLREGLLPF
jgi:hypothetical protein